MANGDEDDSECDESSYLNVVRTLAFKQRFRGGLAYQGYNAMNPRHCDSSNQIGAVADRILSA